MDEQNGFVGVVNQQRDASIEGVVKKLFKRHKGQIPIKELRVDLKKVIGLNEASTYDPLLFIDRETMEEQGRRFIEWLIKGQLYELKEWIVYNNR